MGRKKKHVSNTFYIDIKKRYYRLFILLYIFYYIFYYILSPYYIINRIIRS